MLAFYPTFFGGFCYGAQKSERTELLFSTKLIRIFLAVWTSTPFVDSPGWKPCQIEPWGASCQMSIKNGTAVLWGEGVSFYHAHLDRKKIGIEVTQVFFCNFGRISFAKKTSHSCNTVDVNQNPVGFRLRLSVNLCHFLLRCVFFHVFFGVSQLISKRRIC